MLPVQKFLLTKTFGQLESEHAVEISVDSRNGHKFSLNYNQFTSDNTDVLSQQCRGLILSSGSSLFERSKIVNGKPDYSDICPGSTQIIAHPLNRFFNEGQPGAAVISWEDPTLQVLEKVDGTLIILSMDQVIHEWCVATRSCPEANILLEAGIFTFRTLFEKALNDMTGLTFKDFVKTLNPDLTYCFELCTPYNQVVVVHNECKLHFLAARNKFTHTELRLDSPELTELQKIIPTVPTHDLKSIDKVIEFVNSRDPRNHEGIVLRDGNFNRVKVKNPEYSFYNKARDILSSPRKCLEVILLEKDDDVVSHMPDMIAKQLVSIKEKLIKFMSDFETKYGNINLTAALRRENDPEVQGWNDKKLFAKCVQESGAWQAPCYMIGAGKVKNLKEFIHQNKTDAGYSDSFLDSLMSNLK